MSTQVEIHQVDCGVWTKDGSDLLSQPLINFFARRRVAISLIGFLGLLLNNLLVLGTVPLSPLHLNSWPELAAMLLMIGGLALRSWSAGTLNKSREITCNGPYSLTRNPLYIGSYALMLSFCILLQDLPLLLFVIGPMSLLYRLQIHFEEKRLLFLFPEDWPQYAARVPRFLPRRVNADAFRGWNRCEWMRNREYRTMAACLAGVIGLCIWHHFAATH